MKRKKVTPFEGFLEGSRESIEKILHLLEKDGVLLFNQQEGTFGLLEDKYNLTFTAPVPKKTILRIDSNDDTFLLDQTKVPGTNLFTVFNVGEQVPYIEYRGFDENETISLLNTGEIVYPHLCKFRESPNLRDINGDLLEVKGHLKDAMGYFVLLELPIEEKGSTKTYNELYRPERVYAFFDLLEDILKAEAWRIVREKRGEVAPAKVSAETRTAIKDFLKPFYEEEQIDIASRFKHKLDLQLFGSTRGSKTYVTTSLAANRQPEIYLQTLEQQLCIFPVGGEGKSKANVTAEITSPGGQPLFEDKCLQDSIGTLMQNNNAEAGDIIFTVDQIAREFLSLPAGAKITQAQRQEVEASIDKQRIATGRIDFTEQAEKHKKGEIRSAILDGALIQADKIEVTAGGKTVTGYRVFRLPLYYLYSHMIEQVAEVERVLLQSSRPGEGTKDNRARKTSKEMALIKRYLAQRITYMKREKSKGGGYEARCNFEHIMNDINLTASTEKQKAAFKNSVLYHLETLKLNGLIVDYERYKNKTGRGYAGVKIIL